MTAALLTRSVLTEPKSAAVSDEQGVASFEIDRPLLKGVVSVACEKGFGLMQFDGPPEGISNLTLQPSIRVAGKISLMNSAGETKPAASLPVYLQLDKALHLQHLQVAVTDANGRYSAYLPRIEGHLVELFVEQFNDIAKQEWEVDASSDSEADFLAKIP